MEEHQFTEEGIKNIQVYSSWVVRGTRVVYTCTYQRYMLVIIHNTLPLRILRVLVPCKIKKIK